MNDSYKDLLLDLVNKKLINEDFKNLVTAGNIFSYSFNSPSSSWIINHNLKTSEYIFYYFVYDNQNKLIREYSTNQTVSDNRLVINFLEQKTGIVFLCPLDINNFINETAVPSSSATNTPTPTPTSSITPTPTSSITPTPSGTPCNQPN